ncbi:hypothetical protein HBA_0253 [Sodalis endosymbiont of Henestaris halophilus]|nr:hypothetical protein HBA_0253 [Sodalis endosymbiont of Henestaris halophilus]
MLLHYLWLIPTIFSVNADGVYRSRVSNRMVLRYKNFEDSDEKLNFHFRYSKQLRYLAPAECKLGKFIFVDSYSNLLFKSNVSL